MYQCKNCLKNINANISSFLFILSSRPKQYPYRLKAHWCKRSDSNQQKTKSSNTQELPSNFNKTFVKEKIKPSTDPGGKGLEIEKEIQVCPDCYHDLNKQHS
ncbi:hypothetical protein MNBD_GAMMA12-2512 [hydrothermal vent metagenome]|uniref:Uncharacterized protein n=1 Tax=hydrothermal vent metagenome TaxID=652676 RepID=A0A3B0Z5L4_9ZZZZ